MADVAYVNGQFLDLNSASIPVDERGHQFGDGVYEVIRVYGGKPFLLEWHIERLFRSLRAIRIQNPFTYESCAGLIEEAITRSKVKESTVYLQITRGIAPRSHLFPDVVPSVTMVVREYVGANHLERKKLLLWPDERWANAYIKTLNLLPNVLAKQSAHDVGACEALLVRDGKMLEASSANLWFVISSELYTAPANRFILPGITRRFVLELAADMNLPVSERSLGIEELEQVDEIFLTGTTTEVLSIDEVVETPKRQVMHGTLPGDVMDYEELSPADCTSIWEGKTHETTEKIHAEFTRRTIALV
jgi:D-alanine transaminase